MDLERESKHSFDGQIFPKFLREARQRAACYSLILAELSWMTWTIVLTLCCTCGTAVEVMSFMQIDSFARRSAQFVVPRSVWGPPFVWTDVLWGQLLELWCSDTFQTACLKVLFSPASFFFFIYILKFVYLQTVKRKIYICTWVLTTAFVCFFGGPLGTPRLQRIQRAFVAMKWR